MKSDATLNFGYTTSTTETSHGWIIDGPTNWDGSSLATGTGHSTEASPSMTFCKADLPRKPAVLKASSGTSRSCSTTITAMRPSM